MLNLMKYKVNDLVGLGVNISWTRHFGAFHECELDVVGQCLLELEINLLALEFDGINFVISLIS